MTALEFAEALKLFRLNQKMTQEDMAKEMGVSRTMYQSYESGKATPSILILATFAESKNISIDYILGKTNNSEIALTQNETLKIISETLIRVAQELSKSIENEVSK